MNEDIFSKLDVYDTKVGENAEELKTARKNLTDSKRGRNAEIGRLISELCEEKKMDFRELYRFLASVEVTVEDMRKMVAAFSKPRAMTRTATGERTDNNE